MRWIRKPTSRRLAATLGKNAEQGHAQVTKRPESRLHFQASGTSVVFCAGSDRGPDSPLHCPQPQPRRWSGVAIERGWLKMNESGTYLRFTPAGADLFA
jgi:hypothetical protein